MREILSVMALMSLVLTPVTFAEEWVTDSDPRKACEKFLNGMIAGQRAALDAWDELLSHQMHITRPPRLEPSKKPQKDRVQRAEITQQEPEITQDDLEELVIDEEIIPEEPEEPEQREERETLLRHEAIAGWIYSYKSMKAELGDTYDYRLLNEQVMPDLAMRYTFVQRFKYGVLRWSFTFYKPPESPWMLMHIEMSDRALSLFGVLQSKSAVPEPKPPTE